MGAGELLAQARRTADEAEADRLAIAAVLADPDFAEAYAFRGHLAARQGDAVTAAHHFRVAYARGDHSPETRAALAVCFEAIGQADVGAGIAAGARLPPSLETFAELARLLGPAIRGMLALPLPEPGQPALLPGERRPSGVVPRVDSSRNRASPPPARPASMPPAARPPSTPPAARPGSLPPLPFAVPLRGSTPPRPVVDSEPPPPSRPAPAARVMTLELTPADEGEADWLEPHHSRRGPAARAVTRESWLDDERLVMQPGEEGPRFTASPLELVMDPGLPELIIRSPITGQAVTRDEVARDQQGALMPDLILPGTARPPLNAQPPSDPPAPVGPDPLEAVEAFSDVQSSIVRLALELPGPVITATGARPQQLCALVALGLTADELLLRDRKRAEVPVVRLALRALRRMDLLREGAQLSFSLADGRQLHLDLRALNTRAPTLARMLVAELAMALKAVGAQVNT